MSVDKKSTLFALRVQESKDSIVVSSWRAGTPSDTLVSPLEAAGVW